MYNSCKNIVCLAMGCLAFNIAFGYTEMAIDAISGRNKKG